MTSAEQATCDMGASPAVHPSYEARSWVGVVVLVAGLLFVAGSALAMFLRRHLYPVRARSLRLVFWQSSCTMIICLLHSCIQEIVTPPKFPCFASFLMVILFTLCAGPPMLIRMLRLYSLHVMNRRKRRLQVVTTIDPDTKVNFSTRSSSGSTAFTTLSATSGDGTHVTATDAHHEDPTLKRLRTWITDRRLISLCALGSVPTVVALIIELVVSHTLQNCRNCGMGPEAVWLAAAQAIVYMCLTCWALWFTRRMVDPFFLRRELLHWCINWLCMIVIVLIVSLVPQFQQWSADGYFTPPLAFLLGSFVTQIVSVVLPTIGTYNMGPYKVLNGARPAVRQDENSTTNPMMIDLPLSPQSKGDQSTDLHLISVLSDPIGLELFAQHLEQEFSVENIRFWCDVNAFRAKYQDNEASQRWCKLIVSTYIEESGIMAVNVPCAFRIHVCREVANRQFCATMFDRCQQEIFLLMERDSWPRFVIGPLYAKFVKQCKASSRSIRSLPDTDNEPGGSSSCCSCWQKLPTSNQV